MQEGVWERDLKADGARAMGLKADGPQGHMDPRPREDPGPSCLNSLNAQLFLYQSCDVRLNEKRPTHDDTLDRRDKTLVHLIVNLLAILHAAR